MTIQIRRATGDDLSAFLELHAQVHDLHLQHRPDQFKPTETSAIEARFREWLASPTAKIWVAEVAAKVVGYAVELHVQRPAGPYCPDRHWCDIEQIAVAPSHQRQGVATALMQAVVDSAHAAGLRQIELTSWAFNQDAHRAFESFGFTPKLTRFELKR
jgi:GNAT superfamily N-acetyltransferase